MADNFQSDPLTESTKDAVNHGVQMWLEAFKGVGELIGKTAVGVKDGVSAVAGGVKDKVSNIGRSESVTPSFQKKTQEQNLGRAKTPVVEAPSAPNKDKEMQAALNKSGIDLGVLAETFGFKPQQPTMDTFKGSVGVDISQRDLFGSVSPLYGGQNMDWNRQRNLEQSQSVGLGRA